MSTPSQTSLYNPPPIVANGVSEADYLAQYAEQRCEWQNGTVIQMSPLNEDQHNIGLYLVMCLQAYLALRPIGQIRQDPFVMRLPNVATWRQPDIQLILNDNPNALEPTYMNGPADMCVEIVSQSSIDDDRGRKFREYEQGMVREYWIIDPIHNEALFYRLDDVPLEDDNAIPRYQPQTLLDDNYLTPLLPDFRLHVPTLWQTPLPTFYEVADAVRDMLNETP